MLSSTRHASLTGPHPPQTPWASQTACHGSASEMLLLGKQIDAKTAGPSHSCVTVTLETGRILGGGCNGLVRLATDVQTGRQYALKILNKVQMVAAAEHVFQEQKV